MHFRKSSFYGNVHVGLFASATEKYVFYSPSSAPKFPEALTALGAEAITATSSGSGLLGLYMCANSNGVILPKSAEEEERRFFKGLGLNVHACPDKWNAVGNNMCANDFGAVVNRHMPPSEVKRIEDCLGVPAVRCTLGGYEAVGSMCVATNNAFFASSDISEQELELVEGALKVKGGAGTVNMGVGFVRIGIIANSKGCVVGESTSGYELSNIQQALIGENQKE